MNSGVLGYIRTQPYIKVKVVLREVSMISQSWTLPSERAFFCVLLRCLCNRFSLRAVAPPVPIITESYPPTCSLWNPRQPDGWACFKLSNGTIIPALRLCQDSIQRDYCSEEKRAVTEPVIMWDDLREYFMSIFRLSGGESFRQQQQDITKVRTQMLNNQSWVATNLCSAADWCRKWFLLLLLLFLM